MCCRKKNLSQFDDFNFSFFRQMKLFVKFVALEPGNENPEQI